MKDSLIVVLLAAGAGAITFLAETHLWSGSPYFVIGGLVALLYQRRRNRA